MPALVTNILMVLHMLISFLGYPKWAGSTLCYLLFCISFGILFFRTLKCRNSPGLLFLGSFLWLGFFLKISAHSIIQYSYVESTGAFEGTAKQWDEFAIVSSFGAMGFILVDYLGGLLKLKLQENPLILKKCDYLLFISKSNINKIMIFLFSLVALITTLNMALGINVSGMVAETRLIWPMNALIGWTLYVGLGVLISFFLLAEFSISSKTSKGFFLACFEGLAGSISIISRGLLIFHVLPLLLVDCFNHKRILLTIKGLIGRILIILILFYSSLFIVSGIRSHLFEGALREGATLGGAFSKLKFKENNIYLMNTLARIVIDRWVGAEGLMSVIAYPEKSIILMKDSLLRKPKIGELDIYEKIAQSKYESSTKYSFASLPGPMAFFYYSGSILFVFLGISFFTLILIFVDRMVHSLFENAYLTSFISFYVSLGLSQSGLSPYPLLVSFFMTFLCLTTLWVVLIAPPRTRIFRTFYRRN